MSAWAEGAQEEGIGDGDKTFEDNFVSPEIKLETTAEFKRLEDSEQYLQTLESRLRKIKKDPSVLKQLKEKREECLNNLLNNSLTPRTDDDFTFEEAVKSNELVRHLNPAQAQTLGEIAHLIKHDTLDHQKQEEEPDQERPAGN